MKIKKSIIKVCNIFLLMFFAVMIFFPPIYIKADNSKKTILVDPGHGGIDGGAVAKDGTLEKDINLTISKKVRDLLVKEGYKVIMSREEDKSLSSEGGTIRKRKLEDLDNRQKLIRTSQSDMFISIHLNAFPQRQYYGAQVWYASNKKSENFAVMMQNNLKEDLDPNNKRMAKDAKDSFIIMRNPPDIPAIMIECGFLSNEAEAQRLKSDSYQQQLAQSIARTVNMYFEKNPQ
ncbi:MAG: N-acetylmuramoyl-L-alanine amidase CwlD [Clostridiales bacterium]|uniref:N-acetylmuramoyl-L-alanine amidase CwlD n=1 Tax=Clostridium sp. N3C TaxID=1776758 RepID=UPI00092DEE51|nr:N-acetylmuramoyl-L-alanine amidase CwlD [Clostridium sp. N3C]NLZ49874.1 N-acetylmuramoyl-L-alanine amidase CwlD [Clostridiales bacterium]SCN24141.1 N-acetylmuramoyl-L-alanine amidase AmiB precursor [Clostridium sp. N3C]